MKISIIDKNNNVAWFGTSYMINKIDCNKDYIKIELTDGEKRSFNANLYHIQITKIATCNTKRRIKNHENTVI